MGQYHKTFNLDKKQYIDPHELGDGLKLIEQCGWSPGGTNDALHLLLAACSGRGGGDFQSDDPIIGSWAGDRIAVIGDYAEPDDIPGCNAMEVHESDDYENICPKLIPVMEREYKVVYVGEGWRLRVQLSSIPHYILSHRKGDDCMFVFRDGSRSCEVTASHLIPAVKRFLATNNKIEDMDPFSI